VTQGTLDHVRLLRQLWDLVGKCPSSLYL